MDISGDAYRILKYLKINKSDFIKPSLVINHTLCENREEFNTALESLVDKGLIEETKEDISIRPAGVEYLNRIENQIEESAYEYVDKDYDYCVIKFLYENNWGVKLEEFPIIIKKKAPEQNNNSDEGNLYHYLYFLTLNNAYVEQKKSTYKLTSEGIRHYRFLTDKKKEEKEAKKGHPSSVYQIGKIEQHGNNIIGGGNNTVNTTTTDSNNVTTTTLQKPNNKKWYMVARDEAIKIAVVGIFALLGGFLAGKSCNQSPLKNQIQHSTHDSLQQIK